MGENSDNLHASHLHGKMISYSSILIIVFLLLINGCYGSSFAKHGLIWSSSINPTAEISIENIWQNIPNTFVYCQLDESKDVLINYKINVEALQNSNNQTPLPSDKRKDTLQVRALINGLPYRSSSSYTSTYLVENRVISYLSASFSLKLPLASNNVTLQWKKVGSGVNKWIILPDSMNTSSGSSLSVLNDYENMWTLQESTDNILAVNNQWKNLTNDLNLFLIQDRTITVGYSLSVQPKLKSSIVKVGTIEYVTARIVIDGIAYTDGSETFSTGTWNPSAVFCKDLPPLKYMQVLIL